MATTPRERLLERLETMTDEEIEAMLEYAEGLKSDELPPDYDPEHDPAVGFFSGPTDLSSRTREILDAGCGLDYPEDSEK